MQTSKLLPRLKLITLDVTNTLLTVKNSVGHEYAKVAVAHNVPINNDSEHKLSDSFRKQWKLWSSKHPTYGVNTGLTSKEWWSGLVELTFRDAGFTNEILPQPKLTKVAANLWDVYSTSDSWTLKKDAVTAIRYIRDANIVKLGIISNSDERIIDILYQFNVGHYFDFFVVSAAAKCEKPNRAIFDYALREAEIDKPELALHIGDDIHVDYLAAKKYGWNAILLSEKSLQMQQKDLNQVKKDEIVNSLKELLEHPFLKELRNPSD